MSVWLAAFDIFLKFENELCKKNILLHAPKIFKILSNIKTAIMQFCSKNWCDIFYQSMAFFAKIEMLKTLISVNAKT